MNSLPPLDSPPQGPSTSKWQQAGAQCQYKGLWGSVGFTLDKEGWFITLPVLAGTLL